MHAVLGLKTAAAMAAGLAFVLSMSSLTGVSASADTASCTSQSVAASPNADVVASTAVNASTTAAQNLTNQFPSYGMSQGYQPLNLSDADLATAFDAIAATGVDAVRLDLNWGQVQAAGSTSFDWTNTLRVYDAALSRGMEVLPVSSGVPGWVDVSDACDQSYMNFVYQAGLKLIPRGITSIELWNEANLGQMSPQIYTLKVLIPGAKGFRAAGVALGQTVGIISTGMAPAATHDIYYSQLDFLTEIYANGGKNYMDAIGNHPYTWPADPSVPGDYNWMIKSSELYAVMEANGDGSKKIWATEFGMPTNLGDRGVTEAVQADYMQKGVTTWNSFSWAGPMVFYSFQDLTARDEDPENNFGLRLATGVEKPALQVVRDAIALG
ncbi:MAG: hypothetical protein JWQ43_4130 [Glaciihabitans sp.]|nr:hypothetical protein [Glaciihabitans sp.]